MRRFHSYGPVDCRHHFCVPRSELVTYCLEQLMGYPEDGGHYFTIWGPRQTGKTWLIRQMEQLIPQKYDDQFAVVSLSLGGLRGLTSQPQTDDHTLPHPLSRLLETLPGNPQVKDWADFQRLFSRNGGLWKRPVILMIDEVDTVPASLLDLIVAQFRELYINRKTNWLHGLALIGVRAVVGIESHRGSPFNVQRSLPVPNLTMAEVQEMYQQYQAESKQSVAEAVVTQIYEVTRGQPGLISWFGELLTEKYNPGQGQPIELATWKWVWHKARYVEPNNTVMNLIAKARDMTYQPFLVELFGRSDVPFMFHEPLHNYLYMHGLIEPTTIQQPTGEWHEVCRFTSPFIQNCLYDALSRELLAATPTILPLNPLDELNDVFGTNLNLSSLLERYQNYLQRLKAKGLNPWKKQPRRQTDLHLTEVVGHFHLYAWLQAAIGRQCVVSPEFPTGNGKVDLHVRCETKRAIIEVKSFVSAYQLKEDREKAAQYAQRLGLPAVTLAIFVPLEDEEILTKLSGQQSINQIQVNTVAIGWT